VETGHDLCCKALYHVCVSYHFALKPTFVVFNDASPADEPTLAYAAALACT
jgi:hypothetical protein